MATLSSIITPTNITTASNTQTLTNKTLTSPTITGGALNGTLGATTPSTVAATTISATTGSFTGNVSTTQGGATTVLANGIIGTTTNTPLQVYVNNGSRMQIEANGNVLFTGSVTGMTGLAVTGALSATNTITSSAPTGYRTLQATASLSVAPNAVQNLVTQNYGFYFISETAITGSIAIIASNASGPFIVWQQGTDYSITINTASKFNVYYSSGNQIVIQNKQSGTATFTVINLAGGS